MHDYFWFISFSLCYNSVGFSLRWKEKWELTFFFLMKEMNLFSIKKGDTSLNFINQPHLWWKKTMDKNKRINPKVTYNHNYSRLGMNLLPKHYVTRRDKHKLHQRSRKTITHKLTCAPHLHCCLDPDSLARKINLMKEMNIVKDWSLLWHAHAHFRHRLILILILL